MSFQAFLDEIEKDLSSPVFLLYASNSFILRDALRAIKGVVPEKEREFNLNVFDFLLEADGKISFRDVLDVANTLPFLGKKRFVVFLGNLQRLSKEDLKRLEAYIMDPAPTSVFVIIHEGELKKELRERCKTPKTFSLNIKETEIPLWIRHRASSKGIEISNEVADYMVGLMGPDLGLLSAEIEKIALLGKHKVCVDDIHEIIEGENFSTPFDLVEALERKDTEEMFRIYRALKEKTEDYNLIGVLNWLYGRKLSAKGSQKKREYFYRVFELLNRADRDIKTSGRDFPMEYLLLRLLRL